MKPRINKVIGFLGVVAITLFAEIFFHGEMSGPWEFWAFFISVVALYFLVVQSILTWPIGIVAVIVYGKVFYDQKLYADMSLQLMYVALSVHGWILWARGGENHSILPITKTNKKGWLIMIVGWVAITGIYWPTVVHFKDSAPFVDSALTGASIVTQVSQNMKKLENWFLWLFIDAAYVCLFLSRGYKFTAVLYGLYIALAVAGHLDWTKHYRRRIAGGLDGASVA